MASTDVCIPHLKRAELEKKCSFLMFPAAPAPGCSGKAPVPARLLQPQPTPIRAGMTFPWLGFAQGSPSSSLGQSAAPGLHLLAQGLSAVLAGAASPPASKDMEQKLPNSAYKWFRKQTRVPVAGGVWVAGAAGAADSFQQGTSLVIFADSPKSAK